MTRPLRNTSYAVIAWCFLVSIYGFAKYPDSPYKTCDSAYGYCGKTGTPRSEAEFRAQQTWQSIFIVSWSFGLLASTYVAATKMRARRSKMTANTSLERTREG
jgi:hypothetical protein